MKERVKAFLVWAVALFIITLSTVSIILNIQAIQQRSKDIDESALRIDNLEKLVNSQPVPVNGKDGHTPVKNVEYFDGRDGSDGKDGLDGIDGKNGKSAYETAVDNGFIGTEQDWLNSLKVVPEIRCNVAKNRWEVRYSSVEAYKILGSTAVACTISSLVSI